MRKERGEFFKNHNWKLSITGNIMEVNILDATFNLRTGLFKPFFKKLSTIGYVITESSHPPSLLKRLYKSIQA